MILYIAELDKSKMKVTEHQRMMNQWNQLAKQSFKLCVATAASTFLANLIYGVIENPLFFFALFISGVMALFSMGVKVSRRLSISISFLLSSTLMAELFLVNRASLASTIVILALTVNLFTFVSLLSSLLYYHIYSYLEKQQGFPSFVFNTADIYGEEIYGKQEINSNRAIPRESEPMIMNVGFGDPEWRKNHPKRKRPEDDYTDVTVMGTILKIRYGDLSVYSNDAKGMLMNKWSVISGNVTRFSLVSFLLEFFGAAFSFMNLPAMVIYLAVVVAQIFIYAEIKRNRPIAYILYVPTLLAFWGGVDGSNMVVGAFFVIASVINLVILFFTLIAVINLPLLKKLMVQDGFPSFVKTSMEIVNDEDNAMSKFDPTYERVNQYNYEKEMDKYPGGTEAPIVMNVGYGDKAKMQDKKFKGGWNAFDTHETEEKENEDEDNG